LNPSKAAGPDEIKPRVLKEIATEIAPILTLIFQISLESGVVSSDFQLLFLNLLYLFALIQNHFQFHEVLI
jgi:hypothetical protein